MPAADGAAVGPRGRNSIGQADRVAIHVGEVVDADLRIENTTEINIDCLIMLISPRPTTKVGCENHGTLYANTHLIG